MSIADPRDLAFESPPVVNPDLHFDASATNHAGGIAVNVIFPQQLFVRTVCVERKRAARSGRRLILMLLRSDSLLRKFPSPATDRILLALSRSTRDTDIAGWYEQGTIIGVLFTEIGAAELSAAETVSQRVRAALHDAMSDEQLRHIKLSFYVFPDDCHGQDPGDRRSISVMYPDVLNELDSKRTALIVKRCLDVLGSLALLVLLSPLLLLIACAIKLTSRGPVVFRQKRLGQFGRGITFLKFRSMYTNAGHSIHKEYVKQFIANQSDSNENSSGPKLYKLKGDPRVTKLGAFLRRTSLDELPQLFNVVAGQMSLVGPRPPLPYEFESYATWHKSRLLGVKPGITGFWQVHGRSRVKFDEMVRMDLQYARAWSLWLDIKILLRTPLAVFTGNGAY